MKSAVRALVVLSAFFGHSFVAGADRAKEQSAPIPREMTNAIGMRLILIPAGEFMMGNSESVAEMLQDFPIYGVEAKTDYLFEDEYPRHRVRITRPFYFGRCEVTVGQFKAFTAASGYRTEAQRDGSGGWGYNAKTGKCEGRGVQYNWLNPGFPQTDSHPVVNVTWNDAVAFCQWLSRREGETYRLPTEAEWEYACRAGAKTRYTSGNNPDRIAREANLADSRGRTTFPHVQQIVMPKNGKFTVAVESYAANGFGLCDMHGNVWEWCSDWYGKDYYSKSPVEDPTGPESGIRHVRRGGGWNSFPLYARASFRNWNKPETRCVNLGFRVLLATDAARTAEMRPPARHLAAATHESQTPDANPASTSMGMGQDGVVQIVFGGDVMLDARAGPWRGAWRGRVCQHRTAFCQCGSGRVQPGVCRGPARHPGAQAVHLQGPARMHFRAAATLSRRMPGQQPLGRLWSGRISGRTHTPGEDCLALFRRRTRPQASASAADRAASRTTDCAAGLQRFSAAGLRSGRPSCRGRLAYSG